MIGMLRRRLCLRLIPGWHRLARFWSVRLNAVGLLILSGVFWSPDTVLTLWNLMPDAITDRIHPSIVVTISIVLFGASILARIVQQESLDGNSK